MGLTMEWRTLFQVWNSPKAILVGLGFQYGLMPLLALWIGTALGLSEPMLIGLIIVGSCPGGTASNVMTYLAKGALGLSITLTLISTLLSPLLTPLLVFLLAGKQIDIPIYGLMKSTFWIVLFPLVDGLILRQVFRKVLTPVLVLSPSISMVAISLVIACVVALNQSTLMTLPIAVFGAVFIHNSLGLLIAYYGAKSLGLPRQSARTISLETGMQNSGLGVALASAHFSPLAALPGAIFSIWHNISGVILARHWAKKP